MSRKRRNSWVHSDEHRERARTLLMERAKQDDRKARKVLASAPYWLKVWSAGEIEAYESGAPGIAQ